MATVERPRLLNPHLLAGPMDTGRRQRLVDQIRRLPSDVMFLPAPWDRVGLGTKRMP
jgi:hypothetical protein